MLQASNTDHKGIDPLIPETHNIQKSKSAISFTI